MLLSWLCLRDRRMSKLVWTLSRGVNSIEIMIWTEFRSELIWASFIVVNWTRSRSGLSLHLNRGTGWYLN